MPNRVVKTTGRKARPNAKKNAAGQRCFPFFFSAARAVKSASAEARAGSGNDALSGRFNGLIIGFIDYTLSAFGVVFTF